MTHDIKATVEDLERLHAGATKAPWKWFFEDESVLAIEGPEDSDGYESHVLWAGICKSCQKHGGRCTAPSDENANLIVAARNALPSLIAELRRLWFIEEAAVRYREASEAYQELKLSADMAAVNYANRRNAVAREDLFAALPPRKEGS